MEKMISVIILTYNEEFNLPACLDSLSGLNAKIIVVDSYSTDKTIKIATERCCEIVSHPFENYAIQRNWSFENLNIQMPWILCLDADERLTPSLVEEINQITQQALSSVVGYMLRKRTVFMGRWIKHGGQYPSYHLRLFKTGRGRCESREYDQHFIVDGEIGKLQHDYIDVIGSDLSTWTTRHVRWSEMEVKALSQKEISIIEQVKPSLFGNPIERKRFLRKRLYQRAPLFLRAFLFWFYVYILRRGFLDGKQGLIFHTLRCFWFRFLVDAKLYEQTR